MDNRFGKGWFGNNAAAPRSRTGGRPLLGALTAIGVILAACSTDAPPSAKGATHKASAPPPKSSPATPSAGASKPVTDVPVFKTSGDAAFDAWRADFAKKALEAGRKREIVVATLSGLTPLEEQVTTASFAQAEFTKPIWDYVRGATSASRVTTGQKKLADNAAVFDKLEADYALPREVVAAFWGMETSYGSYIGDIDAVRALASLAYKGNRKTLGESELMATMRMLESGKFTRDQLRKASWAGAVGQTQFMPSTLERYGKDFNGDGKEDVWTNPADALASAANYMTEAGWKKGEPYVVEAVVPSGFDYSLGDGRRMSVAQWQAAGLTPGNRPAFADNPDIQAELFLPAGSYGPAFLLFDNFKIIKKYNNADAYAMGVSLLADKLAGRPDLSKPWPVDMKLPTISEIRDMQTALNKLNYSAGTADGVAGRGTRLALMKFQKDRGIQPADGFPTPEVVAKVLSAANS